nr:hypothetical protein [Tanacetum cinerariifolium]
MVAILEKSDAAQGFEQIIDFLSGSYIHHALTVNPHVYISCIKQFWNTAMVKRSGDVTRLQALVDKKRIVITKEVVCEILQLNDAEGVICLPNDEIFAGLERMGYEKPSTKLTFYKAFFSTQWKFFIHTILHSLNAKRTSWNEFSSAMASALICLSLGQRVGKGFLGVETPLFETMLAVRDVAEEAEAHILAQGDDVQEHAEEEVATDVVPPTPTSPLPSSPVIPSSPPHQSPSLTQSQATEGSSHLVQQVLDTCSALVLRVEGLENANAAQQLEIIKLKARVKKLEKLNKTDEGVELVVDQEKNAKVEGRQADKQAEIYNIDLDHSSKVLSMKEHDTEVVAASTPIPAAKPKTLKIAAAPVVSTRRRKGVTREEMEKEDEEIIKSINETPTQKGSDEEPTDVGSPGVIVYGYDRLLMHPVALPSPDYVPGSEHPPYPDYDHPLPVDASLTTLSLGYVADSDWEEDLEEDPEEDHADYPTDGGDCDDEPFDDDDDDDHTNEEDEEAFEDENDNEEEDEHLALVYSSAVPVIDHVPSAGDIEAFEIRPEIPTPFPSEAEVTRLLALPTLPPSPLTLLSSLLKALDEGYSSKNYVRKFLRALHPKWRAKVMAIEESKDLTSLSLDKLIRNLKVHEMIIKKDSEIAKAKVERKSLALKAKKGYSDEECLTSRSEDEEYPMAIRDFKKLFKRRGRFMRRPESSYWRMSKTLKDKNRRAFVGGSWSDSGEEDDEKVNNETYLVAQASSEICLGVDVEPDEWIEDSGCSKHITGNQKLFSTYKAYNGGNVIFVINLRGNIIGKGRGIRKKGLYVMKLENKPKDKICLVTIDENSTLWHRRLGYTNMRLIQLLTSEELDRNLPKLKFDQHFSDFCKFRKQVHASHKAKNIVSATRYLELLHMDLFNSSAARSYGGNRYTLVIVDDYSRYTWTRFLTDKIEAFDQFEIFNKKIQNQLGCTIVSIRTDHGREFDNEVQFGEFCNANGITHNFSAPRTS